MPRQAWLLAKNDLRQELRDLELVATAGFFTLVVLVMFASAGGSYVLFTGAKSELSPMEDRGVIAMPIVCG